MTPQSAPPPPPTAPPMAPHGWQVTVTTGDAGPFHDRQVPDDADHQVWIHYVRRPVLVLGSTQPEELIDRVGAEADGVEVCRRRSGGGVVALSPGAECWIDVVVPRTSTLWDDDVGRAFVWLGQVWAETIRPFLPPGTVPEVYSGALQGGPAGKLVCFASLGPGEVTAGGHKVIGISQRRIRSAARFQSVAIGRWRPQLIERYVDPAALREAGLTPATMPVGVGTSPWPSPEELAAAFCRQLPAR